MSEYFQDFWILTQSGQNLSPKLIINRDSGKQRYQLLADGSNKKVDGSETDDPIEAIQRFLAGESLRFGAPGFPANRFKIDGGHIKSFGMTPQLWKSISK